MNGKQTLNLVKVRISVNSFLSDPNADDPSLLVIVVDTNPSQGILKRKPNVLTQIINSVSSFGNSHLMQMPQNKLAVVACHHHTSKFLYPSIDKQLEIRQIDGQYEYLTLVEKSIKTNLAALIKSAPMVNENSETLLAGCLAMALCYITRVSWSREQNTSSIVSQLFSTSD